MREIEINSDKYMLLGVAFLVVWSLALFVSHLYAFANHGVKPLNIHFSDYPAAIFSAYLAVVVCRDAGIRKNYPYGVAGLCLLALVFLMKITAHWTSGSAGTSNMWWASITLMDIASSGLMLAEGAALVQEKGEADLMHQFVA